MIDDVDLYEYIVSHLKVAKFIMNDRKRYDAYFYGIVTVLDKFDSEMVDKLIENGYNDYDSVDVDDVYDAIRRFKNEFKAKIEMERWYIVDLVSGRFEYIALKAKNNDEAVDKVLKNYVDFDYDIDFVVEAGENDLKKIEKYIKSAKIAKYDYENKYKALIVDGEDEYVVTLNDVPFKIEKFE